MANYNPAQKPYPGSIPDLGHPLCRGLVGWWMFNERGGGIAHDLSGKGNHGTLTNFANPPTATSGWGGNTLILDGLDDYVSINNNPTLQLSSFYTLSAWMYPYRYCGSINNSAIAISKNDYPYNYRLCLDISTGNRFDTGGQIITTFRAVPTTNTYNVNQWYHVVGLYNGAKLQIYVNGVLENSANYTGALGDSAETKNFNLGDYIYANGWEYYGLMDDVRIYNRALSAAEVYGLYINTVSGAYKEFPKRRVWFVPSAGGISYDETNKIQVIPIYHERIDNQSMLEISKLQNIPVVSSQISSQSSLETGKLQNIPVIGSLLDYQSMLETEKLQNIPVIDSRTDLLKNNEIQKLINVTVFHITNDNKSNLEVGKLQIINIVSDKADIKTDLETNKLQNIPIAVSGIDIQSIIETSKLQVIPVVSNKTDIKTNLEANKLQNIPIAISEIDKQSMIESLIQTILVYQDEDDIYHRIGIISYDETGKLQLVPFISSGKDYQAYNEQNKLIALLAYLALSQTDRLFQLRIYQLTELTDLYSLTELADLYLFKEI